MEDTLIMDAVERMRNGEMSTQEKLYFEDLRKNNPELDQAVVEHLFFMNQIDAFSAKKNFKHTLAEVQNQLAEEGLIKKVPSTLQAKVINMWQRYRRTITVAASIAGIVSLFIASLISSFNKTGNANLTPLVQKINSQESKTRQLEHKLNQIEASGVAVADNNRVQIADPAFRATGFMLDVNNNYIVTNAHVVNQAKNRLVVENSKGTQYLAKAVYVSAENDLAIIQVTDSAFPKMALLPYTIRRNNADLGEEVFLLGFPKQEIVYNEGYVSAKNGYQMDTIYCQLNTNATQGSSGSPVISKNGELVGVISSRETDEASVVYAIKSANVYRAIEEVKKNADHDNIKITSKNNLRGLNRVTQINKAEDYIFMVKGN